MLKEALEEITKTKRQRYEDWRRAQLGGFKLGRKIRRVLMFTVVPALVCLQVGVSARVTKRIDNLLFIECVGVLCRLEGQE